MKAMSIAYGRDKAFGSPWLHDKIVRDPIFWVLMSLGFIGFALPTPIFELAWYALLIKAFVEEFFLRYLLQDSLLGFAALQDRLGPISTANILTSLLFAGLHMFSHSLLGSLLVFFPSLVFGFAWERYGRLWVPVALHFFYNACLFYHEAIF